MYSALFLLNESLSRLSRDRFDIDEFGQFEAATKCDAKFIDDDTVSRGTSYVSMRYQSLWADMPQEFLLGEGGTVEESMQSLAGTGPMGYPSDILGDSYDDLPEDRIPSELHQWERRLVVALVDFHTRYHGWRMFAEDEVGITLDELLSISMPEADGGNRSIVTHGIPAVTERLCENTLLLNQEYLQVLSDLVEYRSEGDEALDLEARAQRFAERMAESVNYCDMPVEKEVKPNIVFRCH
jgi:hypothetical protein